MKDEMFIELLRSVREGGAIPRGDLEASRRFHITNTSVQQIRAKTHLSQSEFATIMGVSVKTLQNWEQDRRKPTGPAATLLRIIANRPRLALEAIHGR